LASEVRQNLLIVLFLISHVNVLVNVNVHANVTFLVPGIFTFTGLCLASLGEASLQKPRLLEAKVSPASDDDVIEELNSKGTRCHRDLLSDLFVLLARGRVTAWVVVS
jgi:hypothetical protein